MSGSSVSPSLSRYRRLMCRGLFCYIPPDYIPSHDSRFLLMSLTRTGGYKSLHSCHLELYRFFTLCKYEIFLRYSSVGLYCVCLLLGAYLLVCHMCVSGVQNMAHVSCVSFVAPNISYVFLKSDTEFSACLPYICSPTICAFYFIHATSVVYICLMFCCA
jgi:hypothetical protein